jgi:proline dehydrogenase
MVDAEESWIQPAIDDLVEELMEKHNRERAIIYNTSQLYRWDRLPHLKESLAKARTKGYYLGVKIVRGAYMEKERERAKRLGYQDPIQPNKEASDRDYDAAIELLLNNLDICYALVGTHNETSSQLLADMLEKHNVAPSDKRVHVAQLYGMSDHISYNMAAAGFNVVKYLPFGPVKDVLPYLFRRAEENTSISGQTSRELALINAELKRRKKARKAKN